MNVIRQALENTIASRQAYQRASAKGFVTAVVVLVGLYILASILVLPGDAPTDFNFVDERGTVTALSAVLLASDAAFGLASFLLATKECLRTRIFWVLSSAALGILALDELLEFHERIGDRIDALGIGAGPVRHWNDVIVIAYGVLALGFLGFFFSTIARFPWFLELLAVAFVFFVLHTSIDSLVEPPTVFSVIAEESCKLYCSAFVSLAFLFGMLAVARRTGKPEG